jgi:hypothetical protein
MALIKSEYAKETTPTGRTKNNGTKLLSAGYKLQLGNLVDEETRQTYGLERGATWSDFIALQTVKRAVGLVAKENICFTAITELRESTEGKTPERIVTSGNEELAALAKALSGEPAEEV